MYSMTVRLFGLLMLATGIVWVCGMAWIYSGSRHELERVLDGRLEEATRMVSSLVENAGIHVTSGVSGVRVPSQSLPASKAANDIQSSFHLACQIWSIDGRLVGRSTEAPTTQLTNVINGYSNQDINGTGWRVYAREVPELGIRVLVGDSIAHRERLVRELMWGLALPGVVVFTALSGLIWVALREGLAPLRRLTASLKSRSPDALTALDIGQTPTEIRPVVDSLNGLFQKVDAAREHERSVTAFAAHELRTPLAGLRTQVQVALAADDPHTRYSALRDALRAADRANRMATQLLAMAHIDANPHTPQEWIPIGARLRAVCDELKRGGASTSLILDEELFECRMRLNPDAFHMAVRNLTENALQHAGAGPVRWSLNIAPTGTLLTLDDSGPGIPDDEMHMVTKRFFRGRHKCAIGSGLGLAIVQTALEKDGLALRLQNRSPGAGLRAQIFVVADRVAMDAADADATTQEVVIAV